MTRTINNRNVPLQHCLRRTSPASHSRNLWSADHDNIPKFNLRPTLMRRVAPFALLAFLATATFAQDEPVGVKQFEKTVTNQAAYILLLAHPLLVEGKSIEFDGYRKTGDVHELNFTIVWFGSKKIDYTTTFACSFKYDGADHAHQLKMSVAKDTCPIKPFKGSNLILSPFRIKVKDKMREYVDDEELLKSIDRISTAEGLLEVWLMYADRDPTKK